MKGNRFIDSLNGLKCFTDRFDLLRVSKGEILSNKDAESLCLADYKVLLCGQNYGPMTREYTPFHDFVQLSKEDIIFLEEDAIDNVLSSDYVLMLKFRLIVNAYLPNKERT